MVNLADKVKALSDIPYTSSPSSSPLLHLAHLLDSSSGQWPVAELQCAYARAWKCLPESVKAGAGSLDDRALVDKVEHQVKTCYSSLLDLLPQTDAPAITDTASQASLSHRELSTFVREFRLPCSTQGASKPRVALALPNGPLLGLAILTIATHFICCPLATASGPEQFRSDLAQSDASIVFVAAQDIKRLGLDAAWVNESNIEVVIVKLKHDMTFSMDCDGAASQLQGDIPVPNSADDTALMLFTSGTSGTKKTVPITLHALVCGIAFVIESWGLKQDDICLNMMPLFHVGGIVRNLFAPVVAGGATICCAAFDANSFWDIVEDLGPTWYYASPTMHQMILDTGAYRQDAMAKSKMRLICNAAGGLLPSLASKLRDTFGCTVLPSYGMTECMPISSPPLDYKLDRSGTSGQSVGPDLAILDGNDDFAPTGHVGRIAVRGAPLFGGYLKADGATDRSPFTKSRFFDTGDLGYLDADGYLFVTGRSKEVINRGGELISPFEVEEAVLSVSQQKGSPIEGRVSAVMAFSMPHSVLQETVGLVIVTPPASPRVCIKTVQAAVKDSLSQVKWPQVLVFSDDLPKNNNKLLRIKMGDRMGMQDLSDNVLFAGRHYEAVCPPPNTPLGEKIPAWPVRSNYDTTMSALPASLSDELDVHCHASKSCGYPELFIAPKQGSSASSPPPDFDAVKLLKGKVDDINVPVAYHWLESALPRRPDGTVDQQELDAAVSRRQSSASTDSDFGAMEQKVANLFSQILACPTNELRRDSDFFAMGGDSIRAGRLLSELRRESHARIPVDLLFTCGQISSIATYIEKTITSSSGGSRTPFIDTEQVIKKTHSSTNPFLLLVQLVPIALIYPMKRALTWTVFMYMLAETLHWKTAQYLPGRLFNLIVSLAVGRLVAFGVAPLFAIAAKWILIGRHRPGLYPMWGLYHTRWWLVQKILSVCGKGHFGMSNGGLVLYYRLLGAKIGKDVSIAKTATLGEYDLLEIGDGVVLDKCICRGFAVEKNTAMFLGKIKIGNNASVGLNSTIAPGSVIPDNTCIGPNSSSWELDDADESHRNLSSSKAPGVNFFLDLIVGSLFALPITAARLLPWVAGLVGLVEVGPSANADKIVSVLQWFAASYRIGFHYFALILHAYFGPMTWFVALVLVKQIVDLTLGRNRPGPAEKMSLRQRLRAAVMKRIFNHKTFHKLLDVMGAHYEITSVLYRLLGARVGERVYWPGTGPAIQDIDLLEVGNDVVFGSRSHLVTSDGYGSQRITIGSGAMISDRVVLAPGTHVGDGAVFGSGALSKRDKYYTPSTVWVGSRGGEAVCLTDTRTKRPSDSALSTTKSIQVVNEKSKLDLESGFTTPALSSTAPSIAEQQAATLSPFGRAFYKHDAPYRVFSLWTIVAYSSAVTIFTAFFWNVGATSSVQAIARVMPHVHVGDAARPFFIYALFTGFIAVLQTGLSVVALAICIGAKWLLLGRRVPGNYNWDKSPYCQRWQLYLAIERLRRACYAGDGILGLLTGTHYMVVYFRLLGANIGRDCALFAGGKPSCLLTEPDLLTLGDRVAVDDASLVAHINSRGVFDLNPLSVGDGSALRSGSRLLSGAKMGRDTMLLEHTLVMAGDEVRDGTIRQGWPSEEFERKRMGGLMETEKV